MLTAHSLNQSFDSKPLFDNVSFNLNPGDRIGLVGPNGCGKTSLLRILAGEVRIGRHALEGVVGQVFLKKRGYFARRLLSA